MALDPNAGRQNPRGLPGGHDPGGRGRQPLRHAAHLLLALLNQPEGIARPLLIAANLDPIDVARS